MAFKEITMFSSLVVVIISYNILESNAHTMQPLIDQDFANVKASLFELGEAEMNLMDDSQRLNDMQREYFAGKVDYSAVERARNELIRSKNKWFRKVIQYLLATSEFEPTVSYQTSNPKRLYKKMNDLENYKDALDDMHANILKSMAPTVPQPVVVA